MKAWLEKLSARELTLLIGGVTVLLFSGLYAFIYLPIIDEQKHIDLAIENQRQLNATLKTISAEVSVLQQNQLEPSEPKGSQSQMSIIDASSEQLGIKTAIKRIVPEGQDTVTLWLEKCEFDKLIYWLAVLDKKHAITVRQINIRQEQGNNGLVSGKIIVGD